jgi:hypothetical protein
MPSPPGPLSQKLKKRKEGRGGNQKKQHELYKKYLIRNLERFLLLKKVWIGFRNKINNYMFKWIR